MKFNHPGWLKNYIEYRRQNPFLDNLPSAGVRLFEDTGLHHELDQSIYYFLQPTGLLYGFPVGLPFKASRYPDLDKASKSDRIYWSFLDSLFACMVADRHYLLEGLSEEEDHLDAVLNLALAFFVEGESFHAASRWNALRPGNLSLTRDPLRRFERNIDKRLGGDGDFLGLTGHFYNSFLFLDIYFCMIWQRRMLVEPDKHETHLKEIGFEQRRLRELILRILVLAAESSGVVEKKERNILEWFFKSSGLPVSTIRQLRGHLNQNLGWENIEAEENPWLLRRFMLEVILMILVADEGIDKKEDRFVLEMVEKLGLWEEELNQSLMALDIFMLNQQEQLRVLSTRPAFVNVGENLKNRATKAIGKNIGRVVKEIKETQELYGLLMKTTHTALTPEEKQKVRSQLMDIIKTIPALAVFALPGGSLVLPILIKLLPFNLLPSSFED